MIQLAAVAPAPAQASRIFSTSASVSAGTTGETMARTGTPRPRQRPDHLQPFLRAGHARLHPAGQVAVQRGDGDAHAHQAELGHLPQDIQVAQDAGAPW